MMIDLDTIDRLTGGELGTFDRTCPLCSASRHSSANRRKPVLRIWRLEAGFAGFCCQHCGAEGYALNHNSPPPNPVKLAKARSEAAERNRTHNAERLRKARRLWSRRKPIVGSIAERYLRNVRRYGGPIPTTLGFLPVHNDYSPALVAAFGLADEIEPGVITLADSDAVGVHLTRLLPDGSDRERGDRAKIMIGPSMGSPIVLAPPNDLLGLAITEGIEDGLSAHTATGLGVMAAGSAGRLPALVGAIPGYIECVTIYAHVDNDGRRYATELAEALTKRKFEVFIEGLE
jgi:hypothetical protein